MKILLISVNNETEPFPVAPIGAACISRVLKNKGHEVNLLDLCFVKDDFKAIDDSLKKFIPDVIGISIRNIDNLTYKKSTFYMPRIRSLVDFVKDKAAVPVVAGGSGFSIFPEEILDYLKLDAGIIGEGETAFSRLVDSIGNSCDFYDIPNLCYIKDGEYRANEVQFSQISCMPDRSQMNNGTYLNLGGMANIQSKRGCPFTCTYCTYPGIDGSSMRLREPDAIVEELNEMENSYGIDYAFFVDDIFNFPHEHAALICEKIIRKNLKISWTCFATPKGMSPELADLMKNAGCRGVEFGSDAGSGETLKELGKQFDPDDIVYAAECCKNVDLPNAHYLILGGPGEDISTLNETLDFFDRISPTAVIALIGLRIYAKTLLHKRAIEDNVIEQDCNLLEPVFYLSPELDVNTMFRKIAEYAGQRRNWIVPGLNIRCDTNTLGLLRELGKRGPLWQML